MGVVWEAEAAASPGVRRALKVLAHVDERSRDRFAREGALLARIDHPNVVRVHATGIERGRPFLVLDFVDGETLGARLARGPLPWREAATLVASLARALHAVHGLGIVHRDVKPANVFVGADGHARLGDFGIATAEDVQRITRTGALLGTGDYLAPERFAGREADARCDIWALGVCLYEAVAGRRPYEATTIVELARKIEQEKLAPASRFAGDTPPRLDRLLAAMLARDPAQRPAALAVAEELERILGGATGTRPGRPLVAALVVTALLAGAFVATRSPAPPGDDPALLAYEEELGRSARDLEAGRRDFARKRAAEVSRALDGSTDERRLALLLRARALEAASQPAAVAPVATKSCPRVARGTDSPMSLSPLDDHSTLARHAEQVHAHLAEARREDSSIELPADLSAFIADGGVVASRKRDYDRGFPLLEKAVALDPDDVRLRLETASQQHSFDRRDRARSLVHCLAVLENGRATREQRTRALGMAAEAAISEGRQDLADRLLEQGMKEAPDSPTILIALCDQQIRRRDPAALATAERFVALGRDQAEKRGRQRLRAKALAFCALDGRRALDELREIRGPSDFGPNDISQDLIVAAKAYVLLRDKTAALRTVNNARRAADREAGSAQTMESIEALRVEAEALRD